MEVHSENYFADGGRQIDQLARIREQYPLSLHGVGLSLGSTDPMDAEHLRKLKRLVAWSEPAIVSEHLSWASVDGVYMNDLLPLPYTEEALQHMIQRVDQLQCELGRQVLVENISSYLSFAGRQMTEWDFLTALAIESGCGLLVDINNIFVSSRNLGFDPRQFIAAIPAQRVHEIHLAGHTAVVREGQEILIDTHSAVVCDAVWELYAYALKCYGPVSTLIEWDMDIPPLAELLHEAQLAERHLEDCCAVAP